MQGLLEGKVAVITGAGSGVGRAAVKLWAEHGAKIIAADINLPSAEESVQLAGAKQGQIKAAACNVADPDSVDAAVALAVETFGRLDVIYNNAGITVNPVPGVGLRKLVELPHDEMRKVEEVNINGVIFGCQAAIRQFDAQGGGGVIVNTASVAGMIGYGGVLYGATKGAVVQLTRGLAIEVAEKNIRVNSVCPAGMLTHYSGMDPGQPEQGRDPRERWARPTARPLNRPGRHRGRGDVPRFGPASNITGLTSRRRRAYRRPQSGRLIMATCPVSSKSNALASLMSDNPRYAELFDMKKQAANTGVDMDIDYTDDMNRLRDASPVHKGSLRELLGVPEAPFSTIERGSYTFFSYRACEIGFRENLIFSSEAITKAPGGA
jgi:NAD(P)-dependent dehydrogenase (short-subunit alcohol dehydrogenase family)